MPDKDLPRTLHKVLHKVKEAISGLAANREPVRIISHYDADGLCAAGILCKTFLRRNIPFHATIAHTLDASVMGAVQCKSYPWVIFSDMGSSSLDLVEKLDSHVVVVDHHEPLRESKKVVQLNAHIWGIDGAFEACGSTLALAVAIALDEANWDLAGIAFAGAIGDRQHVGGWKGYNSELLAVAEKGGHIRTRKGLALEGPDTGKALSESNEPFFRGISGNQTASAALVKEAGIDPATPLENLSDADTSALASMLILHLLKHGTPEEFASGVIMDRHWIQGFEADASELSAVVNACGRLGQEDLGLAVCLGGSNALEEGRLVRQQYRAQIMKGMLELQAKGVQKKRNIQYFYADNAQMAGAFAALVMNFLFPGNLATIALSRSGDSIKISARGTRALLAKGVDLAKACRKAAQGSGGVGGGHNIASGATIPLGSEMGFLEQLDAAVGAQQSPSK